MYAVGVSEMAQLVKGLAARPEDLSSTPRMHMTEAERQRSDVLL